MKDILILVALNNQYEVELTQGIFIYQNLDYREQKTTSQLLSNEVRSNYCNCVRLFYCKFFLQNFNLKQAADD